MASRQSRMLNMVLRALTARRLDTAMDPRLVRQRADRVAARFGGSAMGLSVEKTQIAGIPAEWLVPGTDDGGVLLYLHGGGYIFGSPNTHRAMVATLAQKMNIHALLIDYRLAPEHPFPAAVEDACKAYRWLIAQGVAPGRIVVAGDSAGGGLTLALLIALRNAGDPLPAAAALLSPWTDLAVSSWAHIARRYPMLSLEGLLFAARHYLQGTPPTEPLASPLYDELGGLPPLLIHVGTNEILLDDSVRVAEKAGAAGTSVDIKIWDDMPHVFQLFRFLPESRAAIAEIVSFLRSRMDGLAVANEEAKEASL